MLPPWRAKRAITCGEPSSRCAWGSLPPNRHLLSAKVCAFLDLLAARILEYRRWFNPDISALCRRGRLIGGIARFDLLTLHEVGARRFTMPQLVYSTCPLRVSTSKESAISGTFGRKAIAHEAAPTDCRHRAEKHSFETEIARPL